MRPEALFSLFSDVARLKGVGPGVKKALGRLFYGDEEAAVRVRDLVFHSPVSAIDRRNSPSLTQAKDGDIVTLVVTVETHQAPARVKGKKLPYKVICHTPEGYVTLVFYYVRSDFIANLLPQGQKRVVSGKLERYGYAAQIAHPDIIAPVEELANVQTLEPVYALTGGLTNRLLRKTILAGLHIVQELPEWQDEALLAQQQWKGWKSSLTLLHSPLSMEEISGLSSARRRLAYDELLANQLALALVRKRLRKHMAQPIRGNGALQRLIREALPYTLTQGQQQVLKEISADLASGERMLRLLQGDVGSGKTIVALMAMLPAIEEGQQTALMVPTELLARQHFAFFKRITATAHLRVALLTGSMRPKEQEEIVQAIGQGEVDIVIGTHSLFQNKVIFKSLGLAVIDEQHRFGVSQRLMLTSKGSDTHILVMTATPIPRTLEMTAFGDMDASILLEKPANRLEIATKAIPLSRIEQVLEGIERAIAKGEKIYWICPMVEESEDETLQSDLAAVQARHTEFTHRFGPRVGMVHGRMQAQERDSVMSGFAGKQYDILVATTVIEVGVDVPDATIIVIEHAERFGLSQLHQLRGRVGRGSRQSHCILLYKDHCNHIAQERLRVIRETNDGFRIAEEDLRLRGSGDILGTRQSGLPKFYFADLGLHPDLLRIARDDAKLIIHHDATLVSQRGRALRHLLYLFEYDENIRFLDAG